MNGKLTPILLNGGASPLPRYWLLAAFVVLGCLVSTSVGAQQFLPNTIYSSTVPKNGDLNPYGVAFVRPGFPTNGSKLNPGDILVSNFNNSNNQQGTGTTIIKLTPNGEISPAGKAEVFFQGSGLGLTTALGVLARGFVLVGNVPTKDGTFATIQRGSLLFLNRQGHLVSPSPYTANLDGPWDLTIADGFSQAKVFVSNVLNGTVTRLDLALTDTAVTVSRSTVVATGYTVPAECRRTHPRTDWASLRRGSGHSLHRVHSRQRDLCYISGWLRDDPDRARRHHPFRTRICAALLR